MADEFQLGSGSWWDSTRNRFESATTPASSISTTLNAIASYGWPKEMEDMKTRSSMDSASASTCGSMVLHGSHDESHGVNGGGGCAFLENPDMQMMGLRLSSQNMDWHQALFRGEKSENSVRSFLQEDLSSSSGNHQQKFYAGASSENEFKLVNRGFSLEHQSQFSSQASSNDSTIASKNLTTPFQVDSSVAYGLVLSENSQQQSAYQNRPILNYPYSSSGYAAESMPASNKYPQFLRTSLPKQLPQPAAAEGSHLHFTNNTPFWNASTPLTAMTDARSSYFSALQSQIPAFPSFGENTKNKSSAGLDHGATTKKNNTEISNKKPRNETSSPLPAFKVRKEKMGDRITALQQLVSPFGKTDTASVLSESIEYIKFLQEQVSALTAPYMKNEAPIQNQQNSYKFKDPDAPRHDLRSRGLCLAPVSSTIPVTHEAVDFWTPTFG